MEDQTIISKLKEVLLPYVASEKVLVNVAMDAHLSHDLNIDSYNIVEIVLDVEELFNVEIDDESISQMETFGSCFNVLKRILA